MKNCPEIARNYRLYKEILAKKKQTSTPTILLIDCSETSLWKEKTTTLNHDATNMIELLVAKQNNDLRYQLKLFIPELNKNPALYFDSDGPTIRNTNPINRLSESKIRTPYLSFYNEDGNMQAYRDSFIETHEAELQNNINVGMKYFCSKNNINAETEVPKITEFLPLFPISQNADVHADVVFSLNHGNTD
ncbi:hypothetical protein [Emticicia sp. BO119]|uniref:hypothetical protein n=1 Tax=Emticicia sp. BO119 TaxID=2757768 RepID=UPI0015EFFC72|nr:hypothetical protein [Emticicia sp. BO119]MBA4849410.1 hypothetical protein [Emticicia sp. BO119]